MNQASMLAFDFAAMTDVGCKRSNNEDSFGYDVEKRLFVVCDGLGGAAAGEVASSLAVRKLIEVYGAQVGTETTPATIEDRLSHAIHEANRAVRQAGMENRAFRNMGTTLVCASLDGDRAIVGNVGDSRAYLLRGDSCVQITRDHSYLNEEIEKGNITPEMAAVSNLQSVITRAIGTENTVAPDLFRERLEAGDVLLLTSDGLTRYANAEDILALIAGAPNLTEACRALIEHAKEKGGADNITCVLVRVVSAGDGEEPVKA